MMQSFASLLVLTEIAFRVQSGGAAAVEAEEAMTMTLQPGPKGLLMHCIPRGVSQT